MGSYFTTNGSTSSTTDSKTSTSRSKLLFAMANPKSIILTGASRGIGFAIARFLLKEGHKVFLVARSEEPLEKLKREFKGQVEYLAADLSDLKVSDLLLISFKMLLCSCCLSEHRSRGSSVSKSRGFKSCCKWAKNS